MVWCIFTNVIGLGKYFFGICVGLLFFEIIEILAILFVLLRNPSYINITGILAISIKFTNIIGNLKHGSNTNQYYC